MTRQQAEAQAAQDSGKGFLHLVGLRRESEEQAANFLSEAVDYPEPEGDFGGIGDWASI